MDKLHIYTLLLLSTFIIGFGYLLNLGVFVVAGFLGVVIGVFLFRNFALHKNHKATSLMDVLSSIRDSFTALF